MSLWDTKEILHLTDIEIGYTPSANASGGAQSLKCRYHAGKLRTGYRPMKEVQINISGAEPGETRLASASDAISRHLITFDLRDQECVLALTVQRVANKLFGSAASIVTRRVDQRHTKGNSRAQRFLFDSWRVSPLTEM